MSESVEVTFMVIIQHTLLGLGTVKLTSFIGLSSHKKSYLLKLFTVFYSATDNRYFV